jgi:hypothetical protein
MRMTLEVAKTLLPDSAQAAKVLDLLNRQVDDMSTKLERLVRDPGSFSDDPEA